MNKKEIETNLLLARIKQLKEDGYELIGIKSETKKALEELREDEGESFDAVISKLLKGV